MWNVLRTCSTLLHVVWGQNKDTKSQQKTNFFDAFRSSDDELRMKKKNGSHKDWSKKKFSLTTFEIILKDFRSSCHNGMNGMDDDDDLVDKC